MLFSLLGLSLAAPGYLRQPDLHGDLVVFTAEGDLWTAPVTGGTARRLTSRPTDETSAHFSPDGKWVAFTASYEGNADVYVVPTAGGTPNRLTWGPAPEDCIGWTPDGTSVILRSRATDPNGVWRLATVPAAGGDISELPLGYASRLDIDPVSGRYAFTRLGREAATWKRYRGGSADDIWVGDPKKADFTQITSFEGPDSFPMWNGGRLFFLSDRGGTANLWSMNPDGSDRKALTQFSDWDARWPSMAPDGRIVFMLAGDLHVYDPKTNREQAIEIDLPGEGNLARTRYAGALNYLSWFSLSTDADRVLLTTRGELFSVPVEPGVSLALTNTSGARESYGSYSPDGKRIAYVTDASGEEAIVTADAWGRGDIKTVLPAAAKGWHMAESWSPDGKWLAYADETQTLFVIPAAGGSPKTVDHSETAEITEYVWSPDGRYLAYTKGDARDFSSIFVYDTSDSSTHLISGGNTSDSSPAWDPDGRYLYFLSSRHVNPVFGDRDFQTILQHSSVPCAVLLRPDVPNPFAQNAGIPSVANSAPQAVAEKAKKEKKKKDKKQKEKDLEPTETPLTPVTIDFAGIQDRTLVFPVQPGNYTGLGAASSRIFFLSVPSTEMNGGAAPAGSTLQAFDLESKEVSTFLDGVAAYDLQAKAEKIAVLQMGGLYVFSIYGAPGPDQWEKSRIHLEDVIVDTDPRQEWRQIYLEAWRLQRDFFWDVDMGGLDWTRIRDQYLKLVPRLGSRDDLNDLIGEMIGELGTSHTYVGGGDTANWSWGVGVGLLGADLKREGSAFKITRILHGDQADQVVSPLLEPGVGIKEGDYILAVNNQPVAANLPFEALMQGLAGKRVMLTVNTKASLEGARQVVVSPVDDESQLRYVDWVRHNREYVSQKSGGKLGYIHIPDMGASGLVAFETWLYPQADKDGLLIDVRWNRGGFVSQLILEKLRRPIDGWNVSRHGVPSPYPYARRKGPFAVITNEFAGSDGDIFPKAVQVEGLAPVIGTRSWGGVIGIRADKPAIDQGFLSQPEYAFFFRKGGWSVENQGVIPDIPVVWTPQDVARGNDTQLDRAIAETLARIPAEEPVPVLDPKPKKTRDAYKEREK